MTCREEVLAAVRAIVGDDPLKEFTVADVQSQMEHNGTSFAASTIRTHITSRMCSNAPDNHGVTYDDLERVTPGHYRLTAIASDAAASHGDEGDDNAPEPVPHEPVILSRPDPKRLREALAQFSAKLNDVERAAVLAWGRELKRIRESGASVFDKAKEALAVTRKADQILPILTKAGLTLKDLMWTKRGWSARLVIPAAVIVLVALPEADGLALLGGAIGIPLWVVAGAGGAFIGMLIDEVSKARE
jgi:hypothetical protein